MEDKYFVYMHVAPNNKRYVGITGCQLNRRWQNGYGYVHQRKFYRAIKKYGWDNIEHIVLAKDVSLTEANRLEQYYIDKYDTVNNGYNVEPGGTTCGHLTEEHKKRIGDANRGESNGRYGYKYTEEERKYMSEHSYWRGKKHTEESKKKMSEYRKQHPLSMPGKEHPMAKAIIQYSVSGEYIARYDTAVEAEEKTNTHRSGICCCARGKTKTAGGYIWRYANA